MNEEDMDSLREDRAKCLIAIEDMMRQLSEAIAPVRDWFESGEEYPAKTMIQIVVDAVAELQSDRETLLSTERQYRALKAECDARVSALESRLAEAEAERLLAGKAICSALGICHDYALSIPKIVADLDAQTYRRFVEANKEDALSARVRELEEALRPVLDQRNIVVNGPMVVTLCLTRDEYNRAARALKGEG